MGLRTRLLISFLIIVLLPVILITALIYATNGGEISAISNYLNGNGGFLTSTRDISEYTAEEYKRLEEIAHTTPELLLDETFAKETNDSLKQVFSCIAVREGDTVVFDGSRANFKTTVDGLPKLNQNIGTNEVLLVTKRDFTALVRQVELNFSNGKTGSLFFMSDAAVVLPENRRTMTDALISVAMVLIFTALILIIWIYRGVISKVNRLIYGANNIKEGNLDFSISTKDTDELSELINTFEEMKDRLRADSEEKLVAEKEQRELISNIAHDLKTPLTAIRGYSEGLLDGVADTKEKQDAYIRTIGKKAEELNMLLNELTTYSNISTNHIPYNFNHINVKRYFEDLKEELLMDFERHYGKITFKMDISDSLEMIADPEQLRRVIENIVENSVKYKGEDPLEVEFRVSESDLFVQLEIQDNGKGIKSEELPHIFDRMYRADASRQSGVVGSGLGLSIAKKIMEDHGGRIWATSSFGVGTCFYILIREYTLEQKEEVKDDKNTDNRRRRGNSRTRERLS